MGIVEKLFKEQRKRMIKRAFLDESIKEKINECISRTIKTGNEQGFKVCRQIEPSDEIVCSRIIEGTSKRWPLYRASYKEPDLLIFHTHPPKDNSDPYNAILRAIGSGLSLGDLSGALYSYINMQPHVKKEPQDTAYDLSIKQNQLSPPISVQICTDHEDVCLFTVCQFVKLPPFKLSKENNQKMSSMRDELEKSSCLIHEVIDYFPDRQEYGPGFEDLIEKLSTARMDLPDNEDVPSMQKKYLGDLEEPLPFPIDKF